jgi:hypothetical protein
MLKRLLEFVLWIAVALPAGSVAVRAQADPAALAARDSHQGLLVAVAPYLSPQLYKDKFRARSPYDAGIVALEVYFRNDNDSPIRLNFDTVRLVIGESRASRQKIEALTPEEVTDRVTFMSPKDPTQARRLPKIGIGQKPVHDKNWEELAGALRSASMSADLVPAHATVHGCFYFDIDHHFDWLSNASFDLADLTLVATNKALLFFQIDLAPAVR